MDFSLEIHILGDCTSIIYRHLETVDRASAENQNLEIKQDDKAARHDRKIRLS